MKLRSQVPPRDMNPGAKLLRAEDRTTMRKVRATWASGEVTMIDSAKERQGRLTIGRLIGNPSSSVQQR
jgi:hypothetical protein